MTLSRSLQLYKTLSSNILNDIVEELQTDVGLRSARDVCTSLSIRPKVSQSEIFIASILVISHLQGKPTDKLNLVG